MTEGSASGNGSSNFNYIFVNKLLIQLSNTYASLFLQTCQVKIQPAMQAVCCEFASKVLGSLLTEKQPKRLEGQMYHTVLSNPIHRTSSVFL